MRSICRTIDLGCLSTLLAIVRTLGVVNSIFICFGSSFVIIFIIWAGMAVVRLS